MPLEEFYLAFTGAGEIDLSERSIDGEPYRSDQLVLDKTDDDARLSLGWDEDVDEEEDDAAPDRVRVSMSRHHAVNPDTKRGFHAVLTIYLNLDEVRRIRNMLNLLLEP